LPESSIEHYFRQRKEFFVSLLIVGGLLIVGVLAIVGVVMLSISEQRSEATKVKAVSQVQPALASTPQAVETPASQAQSGLITTAPVGEVSTSRRPTTPLDERRAFVPSEEEQLRAALNGQFHELSHEIHNLHDQAWQLEQRLGVLTGMIDRIERASSGRTKIEEDSAIPFDNPIS
jgi:hypothetical protein